MSEAPATISQDTPGDPPPAKPSVMGRLAARPQLVLVAVLIVLIVVTGLVEPNYFSATGLRNSLLWAIPIGILAAGQTILMLTGGIDLSIAMIATASAYVAANQSPNGALFAIGVGLLVGLISGTLNGVGVGVFKVNPLIMTLAMAGILLGLFTGWATTIFAGGTRMHEVITTIGRGTFFGGNVPWAALVWAVVSVAVIVLLRRTGFGRNLYALGDNAIASRLSGIRAWQVLIVAYAMSGILGSIAGLLVGGRIGAVDLQLVGFLLLPSVAAVVIGGTSIFGGVGTYTGTILGALILGVLQSLLTFLGTGQAVQQVLYGTIVVGLSWMYTRLAASR
ncbi:MAG: ABC transporter permease [Acidimicrobiia bacterium]